ncbi:replicative helicase loader/inhibitor [Cytobacillus luteolus]|uniref:replicative helicase loader/inhibitor n=1 Tax=Litchfieldia luteola TaxID=682179 RepID=UPI001AE89C2A|nr:replicative helicase loader/inhibitor [Cytobacillus luteolus]MBP1944638.1 hypothetical protein [Cytobacillus luteolus]
MTKREVAKILTQISITYKNRFSCEDPKEKLDIWYEMLCDQDYEAVMRNLNQHIKTNRFVPTIAELRVPEQETGSRYNYEAIEDMRKLRRGELF